MARKQSHTGYQHCQCRDCFEITVGASLCDDCKAAGCEALTEQECQSEHSYEQEHEHEQGE